MAGRITLREREVLVLIASGLSSKSIATRLGISEQTVRKHRRRLLAKTGAPNAAALSMFGSDPGMPLPKLMLRQARLP